MALTLTELQAITDAYVDATPNDIYFNSNVLLFKLLGGDSGATTIPGGKTLDVILEYDEGNSGSYGNVTKLKMNKKEVFNKCSFRWAAYYASLTIDLDDVRQNNGDLAIVNLVEGKLANAQKTIRRLMGTEIYASAANGDSFLGLGNLFDTNAATAYGSICANDMAVWAPATSAVAEAISFTVLQAIRRGAAIDDNMEGKPNLYITTETLKDAFEAKLQTQARYSDAKLIDAGFDNILFGGNPIVSDNRQSAGVLDALNLRLLDVWTHQDFNFTKPTWASPVDQPDVKVAAIKWSGNLICKNRKAHYRHTNLTA